MVTYQPIKVVLAWPEKSRKLAKWTIELGEHGLKYRPRTTIRGQILEISLLKIRK
jgi:hypothetical protein